MNNTMMKDLCLPKESKKQIYPNKYTETPILTHRFLRWIIFQNDRNTRQNKNPKERAVIVFVLEPSFTVVYSRTRRVSQQSRRSLSEI